MTNSSVRARQALARLEKTNGAPNVRTIQTGLSSAASIRDAAAEISAHGRLDSLINNAAVFDLAQSMTAVTLAERVPPTVDVSCIRVPAVRLDAARLSSQPAVL
ncbi:hypothetical protein AB0O95_05795 [Rhodoglobus sp. NPDC076762]